MAITWSNGNPPDDLDAEAAGSLAASGALAGGTSSNDAAMTAPGSESAGAPDDEPAPHTDAQPAHLPADRVRCIRP